MRTVLKLFISYIFTITKITEYILQISPNFWGCDIKRNYWLSFQNGESTKCAQLLSDGGYISFDNTSALVVGNSQKSFNHHLWNWEPCAVYCNSLHVNSMVTSIRWNSCNIFFIGWCVIFSFPSKILATMWTNIQN